MTQKRGSLARAALRSRTSLAQLTVLAAAILVGGVCLVLGRGEAGLFVLGVGVAISLAVMTVVAASKEARARRGERELLARIAYLERVTTRAEWRAGDSFNRLHERVARADARERVAATHATVQEVREAVERLVTERRSTPESSLSQRDVELLLVTLLSASTKEP